MEQHDTVQRMPTRRAKGPSSPRERLLMDPGWKFHLGEAGEPERVSDDPHTETYLSVKTGLAQGPAGVSYDDSGWRAVDLPHDWAVEGAFDPAHNLDHGFLPAGIGWYRKSFALPESDLGKRLYLEFDGVFRDSTVWLNGHRLGTQPAAIPASAMISPTWPITAAATWSPCGWMRPVLRAGGTKARASTATSG